jgi:hypothetical protein
MKTLALTLALALLSGFWTVTQAETADKRLAVCVVVDGNNIDRHMEILASRIRDRLAGSFRYEYVSSRSRSDISIHVVLAHAWYENRTWTILYLVSSGSRLMGYYTDGTPGLEDIDRMALNCVSTLDRLIANGQ